MKRSAVTLLTGAVAALLLAGPAVQASEIPWSFNWIPSHTLVESNNPGSYIELTNEPLGKPFANAAGDTDIVATNIRVFSDAPRFNPDSFDGSTPVTFKLRVTDADSGLSGNFDFQVQFTGKVSSLSSRIRPVFVGPTSYVDIPIGDNLYTVEFGSYTPPGPPNQSNDGSLSYAVSVRPLNIQKVPEPSTLALSCVGLSFLGLTSWRKRRQKVQPELAA